MNIRLLQSNTEIFFFFLRTSIFLISPTDRWKKTRYRSQTCSSHLPTRGVSTLTQLVNKSLARSWTTCGLEDYHINDSCCCVSSTALPQIFSRPSRAIIWADETEFDLQIIFFSLLFSPLCCQIRNKAGLTHSVKSQSGARSRILTFISETFLQTEERFCCFNLFKMRIDATSNQRWVVTSCIYSSQYLNTLHFYE